MIHRLSLPLASALIALSLLTHPVGAVQPDEILADPALEARARELSKDLRCLVCRNENIDDSNAELARDLRLLVRERLVDGDSDREVIDFVVDRYGEYVLLNPRREGINLVLWLAGPAMLLVGGAVAFAYIRRRRGPETAPDTPLSDDEAKRLKEILDN
jgi:cytochrome c-type biogenesis protein CcmH